MRAALYDLWIKDGIIVFRGIPGGAETHMALSRVFGDPAPHPMRDPNSTEGTPELADILYRPHEGDLVSIDGERKGAYLPWHFDMVYFTTINHGGILRAIEHPAQGGETGYLDGIAIYDALPEHLRHRIEGLYVTYRFDPDMNHQRYARQPGMIHEKISERTAKSYERMKERLGDVAHPLVFTQAETGRKVCNFSPWFATGIEGMGQAEADEILEQIAPFYLDRSKAYFHTWTGDDMVLWDNWRMLHCASGVAPGEPRHMQRTTILGDYALGRPALLSSEAPTLSNRSAASR
ncbi:MAG: TauD/TfdA family dioxygenase [Hyphomicrobiales bacterium]|nr:MAG: TauD/TfdA family dioxygenase [Hyphomicrobiales bacterium]